ncbi:DUF488 family protein [Thermomonas sp.]|uniref:DUF488 domain-containing protein n=1 Tax=Thermomonas sp. TaxID=1971895 RepID=UPI0035B025AD
MAHRTTGTLWTIGHSNRSWEVFASMLSDAGIEILADVRRFPGSRRHPQFSRDALPAALAQAGIRYWPLPALGGRRAPRADSPNTAWRVEAFRGYADHLASKEYTEAGDALMATARRSRTSVTCAEALWWQCHRRLIADDFVARGWAVQHLMAPGKHAPHALHPDAVMVDGVLRYPATQPPLI